MRVHWKQLLAFTFLGLVAVWALLDYKPLVEQVERVEVRQRVNTCVEDSPRACQRLLNRLLRFSTPAQRHDIRVVARHNAKVLSKPHVRAPEEVVVPRAVRALSQRGRKPSEGNPGPTLTQTPPEPEKPLERPTEAENPPDPVYTAPLGQAPPEPSPDPAPTPTVPEPPQVCVIPDLPVCP